MEQIKFKTTIKCTGCLEKVTPGLNEAAGTENWVIDLKNPDKILTVDPLLANESEVIAVVRKMGYEIEKI